MEKNSLRRQTLDEADRWLIATEIAGSNPAPLYSEHGEVWQWCHAVFVERVLFCYSVTVFQFLIAPCSFFFEGRTLNVQMCSV